MDKYAKKIKKFVDLPNDPESKHIHHDKILKDFIRDVANGSFTKLEAQLIAKEIKKKVIKPTNHFWYA